MSGTATAQPGIKVVVHERTQHRITWLIHGVPGWKIGLAMEHYRCYTCYTPTTRGERHADMVEFLPQHLVIPWLSTTQQATKEAKELILVLKNTGPQTPFSIRERKLHAIDRLEKLFNTMQQEKTQTKVLPREVQTIVPPRVTITVLPPRVPVIVTPLRVMTFRVPIISQKDPTEDRRQGEIFENKNQQRLKHRYTTRITQISQKINQVNITATSATRHQYWLMNMHEQVK